VSRLTFIAAALAAPLLVSAPVVVAQTAAPATVTPIADAARGTMVTLAGTVDRITDEDEFILRDDSGTIRIYVGPNWVPAQVGDWVTVTGRVDDDLLTREVYARTLTMPDGSTVTFDLRYE